MAKCTVCKNWFPPGFTIRTSDNKENKCLFCERDVLDLEYIDEQSGVRKIASKFEIIREYEKFIKDLKDNPKVTQLIVEDAVKKEIKGK